MSDLARQQRIRIALETTFGSEMSGSIASFKDLHAMMAMPGAVSPQRLPDQGAVQRVWQRRKSHAGPSRPTMNVQAYLTPPQTALNAGASPAATPQDGLGLFLYGLMGGFTAHAGSTEAGASTASVVNVGTGHGSRWAKAHSIGCIVNGLLEIRPVASVSGDAITPLVQFSAAPDSGSAVYAGYDYYLADGVDGTGIQILSEFADRDLIYWLLGGKGVPAFNLELNAYPMVTSDMQFVGRDHDDDVGTPIGGSAIADASFAEGEPFQFTGHVILAKGTAPRTYVSLDATVQIQPNWSAEDIRGPSGPKNSGVVGWHRQPGDPSVTATVTVRGYGTTYLTDLDNEDSYCLIVQGGSAAAGAWAITLPAMQLDDVEPAEYGSLVGTQITLSSIDPKDIYAETPAANEQANSPIVVTRM